MKGSTSPFNDYNGEEAQLFGLVWLKNTLKELYKEVFVGNLPRLFEKKRED